MASGLIQLQTPEGFSTNRLRTSLCGLLLVAVLLFGTGLLPAQEFRATILGQVTDKSGALIPNATITAVRTDTGQTSSTTSNADGIYSLPFLNPGVYRVTAEAQGFKKLVRENVTLETAAKLSLNLVMELGNLRQEVTVTAAPDLVETATGSGGTAFNPEETQNLPLNGRQVYMLLDLSPGVMFTQTQFGAQGFSGTRAWDVNGSYTMNGGWTGLNQFLLNGAPISVSGTWQLAPNVDAIQEFKVMTNTYDAQYGRTGGGTVNTTLKSGSNSWHGTAFDYIRNSILDANTYTNNLVGAPRTKHIVNQFGGTVGGPIQKKKMFVFGSFEGWRERVPFPVVSSVPSAEMRLQADGNVHIIDRAHGGSDIFDPLTTRCTRTDARGLCTSYTRTQFKDNTIPANRISPVGLAILKLYPLPNTSGDQNNFFGTNNIGKYSYNQPMVRVDHVFNDANRMYSVFTWQRGHEDRNQNGFAPPIERGNIVSERDNTNAIVDFTHVFSPSKLGDLRVSFGRFHSHFPDGERDFGFTADQLGLKMPNIPTVDTRTAPMISVDRYASIIGNNFSDNIDNHFNVAPSVNQTRGRHTLHYGGEFALLQFADRGRGRPRGDFSFGTAFTQQDPRNRRNNDGSGLADLLLGYPTGGGMDWNDTMFEGWPYYAGYIQDDFRARRNLTLNLGVRWETQTSITERFNRINGGFCYTCVNPLENIPAIASSPALPHPLTGGLLFAGAGGIPRTPYHTYLSYWQPRFGFAWAVTRRTVLRGGYGLYYAFANQHDTRTGFNQRTDYITSLDGDLKPNLTPNGSFAGGSPYPDGAAAPTGSSLGLATSLGRGVSFDLSNRRTPRVQQLSFGVQRELLGHVLLDVKYAHTFTDRMTVGTQWDTIPESLRALGQAEAANGGNSPTLDTQVPNPFFGILPVTSSLGHSPTIAAWRLKRAYPEFDGATENTNPGAKSSYNALQTRLEKKVYGKSAGRGLTFILSYTYSKQFEQNHFLNNGSFRDETLIRELVPFDRTHNFAFSGVWNLPVGKGQPLASAATGFLGGVLNHWAFDWIVKDSTGTPTGWPDGDFTCATYRVVHPSFAQWFNNDQSCYHNRRGWTKRVVPDRFPWIRNPYEGQVSMALQKQFAMTESKRFQLRIEAFNAFNTPIFPGPDTNHNNKPTLAANGTWNGFGTVKLEQQNFPRNVQVSMKIIY